MSGSTRIMSRLSSPQGQTITFNKSIEQSNNEQDLKQLLNFKNKQIIELEQKIQDIKKQTEQKEKCEKIIIGKLKNETKIINRLICQADKLVSLKNERKSTCIIKEKPSQSISKLQTTANVTIMYPKTSYNTAKMDKRKSVNLIGKLDQLKGRLKHILINTQKRFI